MATYRRFVAPGAIWFLTLVTERRRPLLIHQAALRAMGHAAVDVRRRYPFDVLGWVALPDHLHALIRLPQGDSGYAKRVSIFKRLVSTRIATFVDSSPRESMRKRRESGIWQRRFWEHMVRDEGDFQGHLDYIHYNPVKHDHARSVLAWPYSSFHRYVRVGILPADWAGTVKSRSGVGYGE